MLFSGFYSFSIMVLGYLQNTFGPYFWPFAIVCTAALTHVGKKCLIMGVGSWYLAMSRDKSFKLPNYDPGAVLADTEKIMDQKTKTLLLIRHGESMWNEVFNRGFNLGFPLRFLYALATETMLFVTQDSCLFDSPLSSVGITQAAAIRKFIVSGYASKSGDADPESDEKMDYISILRSAKGSNSLIVTSPLRRCIETVSLGLFDRINESKEGLVLHSSLQEMTRNVDGVSLSWERERPPLSLSMRTLEGQFEVDWDQWLDDCTVLTEKAGFKSPDRRGDDRMRTFVQWLFEQPQDVVIVSGHSLWNRCFFQAFLPKDSQHPGKIEKIANGGVVAVQFSRLKVKPGVTRYAIHEDSITEIIKGFEFKKRRKSKKEM